MPDDPAPPPKQKKPQNWNAKGPFRPSAKMRSAIYEVIGRVRLGLKPDYKTTGGKWGVNHGSLETLYRRFKKGLVRLDEPPDILGQKQADVKAETERTIGLLTGYEQLLNDSFEKLLAQAGKEVKEGNVGAVMQLDLPAYRRELEQTRRHRMAVEKNTFDYLEAAAAAARRGRPTDAPGSVNVIVQQNNHGPTEKPANAIEVTAAAVVTSTVAGRVESERRELEELLQPKK